MAARISTCPPFFWIVILMTFIATLRIYGIASRNFITTSMDVDAVSCSFAVIFGTDMDKFVVKRNDENE